MNDRLSDILYDVGFSLNNDVVMVERDDFDWLIKQAERVQELECAVKSYEKIAKHANISHKMAEEENKRYREALEFYADEETYEPPEVQIGAVTKEGYKILKYKYDPIINTDKGKKAREALEGEE